MSFLYPLGLLGLIGIPVIVVIYILQSKYTEQTVNSNYLWHLSDKFLKHKNPLSGITGLISLILQILIVAIVSLAVAHPVFTLPNAANNYCFVLDTSASMTMQQGKEARIERAKDEIEDIIKSAKDGSTYSLVCVSNEIVRAFDFVTDKKQAIELIEKIEASHTGMEQSDLLLAAQDSFNRDTSTLIYLVTDKSYVKSQNAEIIDVREKTTLNRGIFDVEYTLLGGTLTANASLVSYVDNEDVAIELYVDGEKNAEKTFSAQKDTLVPISFSVPCEHFAKCEIKIKDSDDYALDNSIVTYNTKSDKSYSILIVSKTGFFFKAVIDALVDSEIKIIAPEEYETETEEYGLYIFDSYEPSTLPNGAVWLVNADESIENSGFGVRGNVALSKADTIQKSTSTSTSVRNLLKGIGNSEIYITDYVKYSGMYLNFYTLFTYDSNPLIFAGANGLGNRQVVFGFDLHRSDFALSTDFVILIKNLLEYSFPDVIDETNYIVGEEALVNVLTNAENLKAKSPSGKDIYMETDGTTAAISLDEVGTYSVSVTVAGRETTYSIYSSASPMESNPNTEEEDFSVVGERTESEIDGKYDPLTLLFILLAIVFFADWGVYCYEKYQLR